MDNNRLTGSYYTSKRIAQYMADWAIRNGNDSFLEPSFGDGVFLDAAFQRYNDLKNPSFLDSDFLLIRIFCKREGRFRYTF